MKILKKLTQCTLMMLITTGSITTVFANEGVYVSITQNFTPTRGSNLPSIPNDLKNIVKCRYGGTWRGVVRDAETEGQGYLCSSKLDNKPNGTELSGVYVKYYCISPDCKIKRSGNCTKANHWRRTFAARPGGDDATMYYTKYNDNVERISSLNLNVRIDYYSKHIGVVKGEIKDDYRYVLQNCEVREERRL